MKALVLIAILITLVGCASQQLRRDATVNLTGQSMQVK